MKANSGRRSNVSMKWLTLILFAALFLYCAVAPVCAEQTKANRFAATGPTEPVKMSWRETAVEVTFEHAATSLRFTLPSFPSMVTENGIVYSNFWAETYDPRDWKAEGGLASFEPLMDRKCRYARMWIERQSDARIVVRVRGALCNREESIARPDFPSGSPYGPGEWVDEWFYIYPDGTHIRHVKVYTAFAPISKPFGFDREPPAVVHEFMESAVLGQPGHKPTDDIDIEAYTLIKMVGDHSEAVIPGGKSGKISYKPYPKGFGEFRDANIMLVNLKAKYRPFTIALPYGVKIQPYMPEDDLPHVFQTWGYSPTRGYSTALGHILNFWHYRRTDNTIEQVYLQGMTDAKEPAKELVPLAWSWIAGPKLRMEGLEYDYDTFTYDQAQKAYVLEYDDKKEEIEFELDVDEDFYDIGQQLINPAIVIKDWGRSGVELKVDGKALEAGEDFRIGYEETHTGSDLILWLKMKSTKSIRVTLKQLKNE
jgi:hypothetical protein